MSVINKERILGMNKQDSEKEEDAIRQIYELAVEFGEGVKGKVHIIDVGHEIWHDAKCIHHADGYGVLTGDDIVDDETAYGGDRLIYYFECIDNFKEISPIDFLAILRKELGK